MVTDTICIVIDTNIKDIDYKLGITFIPFHPDCAVNAGYKSYIVICMLQMSFGKANLRDRREGRVVRH